VAVYSIGAVFGNPGNSTLNTATALSLLAPPAQRKHLLLYHSSALTANAFMSLAHCTMHS
jgi:hypothetical protein